MLQLVLLLNKNIYADIMSWWEESSIATPYMQPEDLQLVQDVIHAH